MVANMAAIKGKDPIARVLLAAGLQVILATLVWADGLTAHLPPSCQSQKIPSFKMDTARLTIVNDQAPPFNLILYTQSAECYECNLQRVTVVIDNCTVLVDTRWQVMVEIRVLNNSKEFTTPSCSAASNMHLFLENGEYSIYVQMESGNDDMQCRFVRIYTPSDANIPIYVAFGIAVSLPTCWLILKSLYRRHVFHKLFFWRTESIMSDLGTPVVINPTEEGSNSDSNSTHETVGQTRERLGSLDTFRGLSIVIMIFVNYRGGYYWFFRHSKWNGLTVADLVFPWFVYIMGTAMMLSFQGQLRRGTSKLYMLGKIVRRSLILFALGLVINSLGKQQVRDEGVNLSQFRIPGVLQRFAGTYLIVATVHLIFAKPIDISQQQPGHWSAVRDIIDFWPEWLFYFSVMVVHTAITFGLTVPGCPRGYLGAGGEAEHQQHVNCTGGAAGYIDRQVFGSSHLDQHPTCLEIYHTLVPYDPEGLLGTLTSIFLCFLGLQAGKILFFHKEWMQRFVRFIMWGIFTSLIGGILCKFSKNDGWIPINKNLWSLSFVLVLAGMAFILLAACYMLIDVFKAWNGSPFKYPGMNPIVLYVGHELLAGRFPICFEVPKTHPAQLAMNLWGAAFWVLVAYYLRYKGIFITV